jgi:hypothetical protein
MFARFGWLFLSQNKLTERKCYAVDRMLVKMKSLCASRADLPQMT